MTVLQTAGLCVVCVVGVRLWGLHEQHLGAEAAQIAQRLQADSLRQDSTLRAYESRRLADSALIAQNRSRIASEARIALKLTVRGDSLEQALRGDTGTYVRRDSALAVVAARDSQIAHLTLANVALTEESAILLRGIASRDSTIASLDKQLSAERHATAQALAIGKPGFLGNAAKWLEGGLALYGAVRLVRG